MVSKLRKVRTEDVLVPIGGAYPEDAVVVTHVAEDEDWVALADASMEILTDLSGWRRATARELEPDSVVVPVIVDSRATGERERLWIWIAGPDPQPTYAGMYQLHVGSRMVARLAPDEALLAREGVLSLLVPPLDAWFPRNTYREWITAIGRFAASEVIGSGGYWELQLYPYAAPTRNFGHHLADDVQDVAQSELDRWLKGYEP